MHTSEPVIIGRTINGDGISARRGGAAEASRLGLVVLLLVLLDVLGVALALFVELLVLGLDLGFAVLGVGTTAAGTVFILLAHVPLRMEKSNALGK